MSESQPIHRVRRRERAVEDDAWIRARLREVPFGSLASVADGQPFINPVLFIYDEAAHAIYFHTGRAGRIFANLTANPRACFNVSCMHGIEPGTTAAGFDVAYDSVTVFGSAHLVEDEGEALRALRGMLERYSPELRYGEHYAAITPAQLQPTAVWRLAIEAWSGKRNPNPQARAEER